MKDNKICIPLDEELEKCAYCGDELDEDIEIEEGYCLYCLGHEEI